MALLTTVTTSGNASHIIRRVAWLILHANKCTVMKVGVISYSLTGNNDALAAGIASALSAEHIRVVESRPRTMGRIFADVLLNRTPAVMPPATASSDCDLLVFVAPVWMGHVASPLRSWLRYIRETPCRYAFVSICGGAEGPNPGIVTELAKRTGKEPVAVVEMHIADLLPTNPRPEKKDTMNYHVSGADVQNLVRRAVIALQEVIAQPAQQLRPAQAVTPAMSSAQKALLVCGILSSLHYMALNIFVPLFYEGYDPLSYTVSELSAIGAPTRSLWVWTSWPYTILVAAFGWGVWRVGGQHRRIRFVGIFVFIYGALGVLWPFASMHRREVLAAGGGTISDTMHLVLGGISVLLMVLSIGFGAAAFGKKFRSYSIATLAVLLTFGILTAVDAPAVDKNLPTPWIGLWERINIGAFLVWIVVLASMLLTNGKRNLQH